MPKKKNPRNGLYWFMQELIENDFRREGRVFPNGMQDIVQASLPRWQQLPARDKARYEQIAKDMKKNTAFKRENDQRLDNIGNVISQRKDPEVEDNKRRIKDKRQAKSHWPTSNDDIQDYHFFFLAFEALYMAKTAVNPDIPFLPPVEIGMVEWSMRKGIIKTFHKFIDPGGIPLGYRLSCKNHSEENHQLPIDGFDKAESDYHWLWTQMENFVNPSGKHKEYAPLYCLVTDYKCVTYCMDWLSEQARAGYQSHRLSKLFVLEDMVMEVFDLAGQPVSEASATDMLTTSTWDYEPDTCCSWHDEREVKFCALGKAKRFAFALSDSLSTLYGFELTKNHLPSTTGENDAFTSIPSTMIAMPTPPRRFDSAQAKIDERNTGEYNHDNYGFASRDIRYPQKPTQFEDIDEPDDDDPDEKPTMRRPNLPSVAAFTTRPPPGPPLEKEPAPIIPLSAVRTKEDVLSYSAAAAPARPTPTLETQMAAASLYNSDSSASSKPDRTKFAQPGRAAPPQPTVVPKPVWNNTEDADDFTQRRPTSIPMSLIGLPRPRQEQPPMQGQGEAAQLGQQPPSEPASYSAAAALDPSTRPKTYAPIGRGRAPIMPANTVHIPSYTPSTASSQPTSFSGLGRGRGLWSGQIRTAGMSTGTPSISDTAQSTSVVDPPAGVPARPPPGFGRGIATYVPPSQPGK